MRKFFDEVEREKLDSVIQQPRVDFQKRNLLGSVGDFTVEVLGEIERWLFSFPSGMTKDAFSRQMSNLDGDPKIALEQLKKAHGYRVIKRINKTFPRLDKSFLQCMADGKMFITVQGAKGVCEKYVLDMMKSLKRFGSVYVLDCAVLFAEFKSARERGCADELLDKAKKCDFLVIENLAQHIGYVSNVASWALVALVNARVTAEKPILARYNVYKKISAIYEKCPVYSLDGTPVRNDNK